MLVSTSGQVAIGTSNPRYSKLFIAASQGTTPTFGEDDVVVVQRNANTTDWAGISILSGSGAGSYINFGDSDSFDIGGIAYFNTDDTLRFYGNGGEQMRIDASGYVGIGTTSPQSALHVPDGKYAQFEDNNAGPPPSADCDSNTERGRISIDTTNNRFYVCNGATRGWDYIVLAN
jgi:hypothetical protein